MPDFRVESGQDGSVELIRVLGDFDLAAVEAVSDRFREALASRPERVALDLTGVAFIDSVGLKTVVSFERDAAREGVGLVVVPPDHRLTELLSPSAAVLGHFSAPVEGPPVREEFSEQVELRLSADVHAPGRCRTELRGLVAGHFSPERLDAAELMTSELVTNAVRHAAPSSGVVSVSMTLWPTRVCVCVRDSGLGFDPLAPPPSEEREGGRGLFVVDQLASRWGTSSFADPPGFEVWFELEA